jgi:hypothetical protein
MEIKMGGFENGFTIGRMATKARTNALINSMSHLWKPAGKVASPGRETDFSEKRTPVANAAEHIDPCSHRRLFTVGNTPRKL